MNRLKSGLCLALWLTGVSATGLAQNPQQNDAERLRVELAERARQEAEKRDWETRIFPIRYVDPDELRRTLTMFRSDITYSGGGLRVLSVRAPKEIMPAIEDAIKRLDVPSPRQDAELTIFVVLGSNQADTNVPPALQPVINQLKNVLSYRSYQLVDTLITRASESRGTPPAELRGTVMLGTELATYDFRAFFRVDNPDAKAPTLHLSQMTFGLHSGAPQQPGVRVAADVDIPQGQQIVVGKATMGDRAVILIMTSKFSN